MQSAAGKLLCKFQLLTRLERLEQTAGVSHQTIMLPFPVTFDLDVAFLKRVTTAVYQCTKKHLTVVILNDIRNL